MMDYGTALMHLKSGRVVARSGWLAAGISLCVVPGLTVKAATPPLAGLYALDSDVQLGPYIAMSVGSYVGVWPAPHNDMLADDWIVVSTTPPVERPTVPAEVQPAPSNRKRRRAAKKVVNPPRTVRQAKRQHYDRVAAG